MITLGIKLAWHTYKAGRVLHLHLLLKSALGLSPGQVAQPVFGPDSAVAKGKIRMIRGSRYKKKPIFVLVLTFRFLMYMCTMAAQRELIKRFQTFTSCDVSDALCKLGHPFGGFLPGITMWSPQRQDGDTTIVGRAYTVTFASLEDPRPKLSKHYIDSVPKDAVLFLSCPPNTCNAAYGGLMSRRATFLGAKGVVIDGRFRDVQEQRDLRFPVFARDVGTSPPYGEIKAIAVNELIQFDNHTDISAGDILIADVNGVVVVPRTLEDKILDLMHKAVAADENVGKSIDQGMSFAEASKLHR